jgi:hypothetical protein
MSTVTYESDLAAWACEQAKLLRSGQLLEIDADRIAEEIEDVGKSERRELSSRLAVLLAHLLKWQYQPERQGASWEKTIKAQRKEIEYTLNESPSLRPYLNDEKWMDVIWSKSVAQAVSETGLDCFPETIPWGLDEILSADFFPLSQNGYIQHRFSRQKG